MRSRKMRSTSFAPDDHAAQARARKGVAHPTIFRLKQTGTHPPAFELVVKARVPTSSIRRTCASWKTACVKSSASRHPHKMYVLPSRS